MSAIAGPSFAALRQESRRRRASANGRIRFPTLGEPAKFGALFRIVKPLNRKR
jgi:hypothetical protein